VKETLNYDEVVELIGPPFHEEAKRKIEPDEFESSLDTLAKNEEGLQNI
jgi:spastic paraplegia protein 7